MTKKTVSILLALLLCLGCLSGCGEKAPAAQKDSPAPAETEAAPSSEDTSEDASEDASEEEAPAAASVPDPVYAAAYAKYAPDTPVIYVDDAVIPWSEYFTWLYMISSEISENFDVTDWSAVIPEMVGYLDDPTYNAYALSYAQTNAAQTLVLERKAAQLGAELTDAQQQKLDDSIASYITSLGGDEAYDAYLSTIFISRDYFRRQNALTTLYDNLHDQYFIANGEELSDEDALSYLKDNGYLHAKHILFKTVDDSRSPLDDDAIAAQKAKAEETLAKLQAVSPDALEETFDSMMAELSEDPGSLSFPNGYYFRSGEMVSSFENAVAALEDNEMSGLVESEYGFHIIYRPAMNADDLMDYDSYGAPYTPRDIAADSLFTNILYEWFDAAEITVAPEFENLNLNDLLG